MELFDQLRKGFIEAGLAKGEDLDAYIRDGKGQPEDAAATQLLVWDALSIKNFVFDTMNAMGVRGASYILANIDVLVKEKTQKTLGFDNQQILFAGGGCGMAVATRKQCAAAIPKLHALFARHTLTASCACKAVNLFVAGQTFAERVTAANQEMARWRALNAPDPEAPVPPFVLRCGVCGQRAAHGLQNRLEGSRYECLPCQTRIDLGKKVVQDREPKDYQQIADRDEGGHIAVLYLDGNKIGKKISQLHSPLAYARFSRAIDAVFEQAYKNACGVFSLDEEYRKAERTLQRPIHAGDDVVVILPGDIAVPYACEFLRQVENMVDRSEFLRPLSAADPKEPIGAAAGVAIGHVNFPVRHLLLEAEALLDRAKTRIYDREPKDGKIVRSALDFAVVHDGSPRADSGSSPRLAAGQGNEDPGRETGGNDESPLLISGRPYCLREMRRFSARREILWASGLGKSQLHSLRRFYDRGQRQLENHILYQIGRHQEWRDLVQALAAATEAQPEAALQAKTAEGAPAAQVPTPKDAGIDRQHDLAQILPNYGGLRVLDIADMLELDHLWQEPAQSLGKEATR